MPHFPQKTHITRKDFLKLVGGAFGIGALSYFIGINDHPAPTPGADAPEYIDSASAFPVFRGPYLQKNARLAAMLFPADLAALTAHCNQTINASLTSPFTYIPLTSSLLVVYANMLVSSLDERDSRVGLIPETEVGFWLLTIAMRRTATGLAPDHLAWHLPYLFVDESNATATGREVYGFNKLAGSFTKPGQTQPSSFALNVLAFRQFGPESIAQTERLLEVQSPASQAFPTQWHDWQSAKSDLSAALLPQLRLDLGQEIVARMHARGHPKQKLVAIKFESISDESQPLPTLPVSGSPIATSPAGEAIGAVTSSALSPMLGASPIAFAQVRFAHTNPGTVLYVPAEGLEVKGVVQSELKFWPPNR